MHQVLLAKPLRHSEDLDLVLLPSADVQKVIDALIAIGKELGLRILENPVRQWTEHQEKSRIRQVFFKSEWSDAPPVLIKVDIAFTASSYEMAQLAILQDIDVESSIFSGSTKMRCVRLIDLAASKLDAMNSREAPRDFSDYLVMVDDGKIDIVESANLYFMRSWGRRHFKNELDRLSARFAELMTTGDFVNSFDEELKKSLISPGFDSELIQAHFRQAWGRVTELYNEFNAYKSAINSGHWRRVAELGKTVIVPIACREDVEEQKRIHLPQA